jgi:hypothetical protein
VGKYIYIFGIGRDREREVDLMPLRLELGWLQVQVLLHTRERIGLD